MVCDGGVSIKALWSFREKSGETHPLDYPCADPCDMAFDYLVPRRAEDQRAPLVYRRKQRITVLEAMPEVGQGFVEFFDEPDEFALL